jgi:hypothetical protein
LVPDVPLDVAFARPTQLPMMLLQPDSQWFDDPKSSEAPYRKRERINAEAQEQERRDWGSPPSLGSGRVR